MVENKPGFKKPEQKKVVEEPKQEQTKDDWVNVGWLYPTMVYDREAGEYSDTPTGKTLRVTDNDNRTIGYIQISSMFKLLNNEVKGIPIKIRENP